MRLSSERGRCLAAAHEALAPWLPLLRQSPSASVRVRQSPRHLWHLYGTCSTCGTCTSTFTTCTRAFWPRWQLCSDATEWRRQDRLLRARCLKYGGLASASKIVLWLAWYDGQHSTCNHEAAGRQEWRSGFACRIGPDPCSCLAANWQVYNHGFTCRSPLV